MVFSVLFNWKVLSKICLKRIQKHLDVILEKHPMKNQEHCKVLFNALDHEFSLAVSSSSRLLLFAPSIIFSIIYFKNESLATELTAGILVVVAELIFIFSAFVYTQSNSSLYDKVLSQFKCPICLAEFCWFPKKEFDTDEKHYTKHERKEETDSKGKIHIVYKPIDYVKYKHHTIYHCDICHHENEVVQDNEHQV